MTGTIKDELFELSREVHKLTNWRTGRLIDEMGSTHSSSHMPGTRSTILYTSDYLLEKLQTYDLDGGIDLHVDSMHSLAESGQCDSAWQDTPLKALLKLTIALHEAGELK